MLEYFNQYFISLFRKVTKEELIPAAQNTVLERMAKGSEPQGGPPQLLQASSVDCQAGCMQVRKEWDVYLKYIVLLQAYRKIVAFITPKFKKKKKHQMICYFKGFSSEAQMLQY